MRNAYQGTLRLVVQILVSPYHQSRILRIRQKSWAHHKWVREHDDPSQVPCFRKFNGSLQAAGSEVAGGDGAVLVDKEDGKSLLFASQQNADLGAERREGDVPMATKSKDRCQDRIDEEVELRCAQFHAAVFGFPKRGMLR